MEWTVDRQLLSQSHLSLQDVPVPVSVTTPAGTSYNPTADTVKFAFMPTPTQVPGLTDWVNGTWQTLATNILYPYQAVCLVGPGGTTNPGIGTYVIYLQVTDTPEIPVLYGGQLEIT